MEIEQRTVNIFSNRRLVWQIRKEYLDGKSIDNLTNKYSFYLGKDAVITIVSNLRKLKNATIDRDIIVRIREEVSKGRTLNDIAMEFNTSKSSVARYSFDIRFQKDGELLPILSKAISLEDFSYTYNQGYCTATASKYNISPRTMYFHLTKYLDETYPTSYTPIEYDNIINIVESCKTYNYPEIRKYTNTSKINVMKILCDYYNNEWINLERDELKFLEHLVVTEDLDTDKMLKIFMKDFKELEPYRRAFRLEHRKRTKEIALLKQNNDNEHRLNQLLQKDAQIRDFKLNLQGRLI